MKPAAARQLFRKVKPIDGWFSEEAAYLFALLDQIQKENGIQGDIFEIGTHHGRSAVFLAGMLDRRTERLQVCDIFGEQIRNISESGHGDCDVFIANMRAAFGDFSFLRLFQTLSADLRPELIGTNYRFFHIDGGHLASECLGDLELAAACLAPYGVIILDDAFRPEWPAVTEALFTFLARHRDTFVPLVVGFNKLILLRASARELYEQHLTRSCWAFIPHEPFALKRVAFLGNDLYVFHLPTYKSQTSLRSRLSSFLFHHPRLESAVARVLAVLTIDAQHPSERESRRVWQEGHDTGEAGEEIGWAQPPGQ